MEIKTEWNLAHGCAVLTHSVVSNSCDPMDCSPPDSSVHGDSPGKNTGVGCHAFLQGIFPIQGLNLGLSPTLQADSVPSEPPGKPSTWLVLDKCLLDG